MSGRRGIRVEFSKEHDSFLVKYLATYCPTKEGRSGHKVFQRLVANEQKQWPWSVHHTAQSWRERYVKHSDQFDRLILNYQRKHNHKSVDKRKRAAEPVPIEMVRSSAKRTKLEEEVPKRHVRILCGDDDVGLSIVRSETPTTMQHEDENSSRPKPVSKSPRPRERPEAPSQTPNAMQLADECPITPATSLPRSDEDSSANAARESSPEPIVPRPEQPQIPSPPPDRQAPTTTDGPPRHVKRIRVQSAAPSDLFASPPPSPRTNTAAPVVSPRGPSSQTQPGPPALSADIDGAPITTSVHPRAPPRVVDSFHGQVLVDRQGHIPRALPHRERNGTEEENEGADEPQWPPVRSSAVKQKRTSRPGVADELGRAKPVLDQHAVAARFSDQVRSVEGERQEDVVRNGTSPVKRVVTTAPSGLFPGHIPKLLHKVPKFPAPRASTRSPFRPEPPAKDAYHPPLSPQPRPPLRTRVARHPALARLRRQTIGHGHENGNENVHKHERRDEVPSIDLVALSHSSMSTRSHSLSSMDASLPPRPPRWSLPAFAHTMPWLFDPLAYGDVQTHERTQTSTPRFMLTPSPTRSISGAAINALGSHASGIATPPSASLTPHSPDLQLTASHGLASILAHMSVNHGLALGVVEAVYQRVGCLKEADEVLRGMREAAEGYGEREIKRRVRERRGAKNEVRREARHGMGRGGRGEGFGNRRTQLRYVVASEDGEGSEYLPPETSRAAMWKRQSESSYVEEEKGEGAEEGRVVDEHRDRDGHEDDDESGTHDFSRRTPSKGDDEGTGEDKDGNDSAQSAQGSKEGVWGVQNITGALVEDTRLAQEMEKKLGKGRYRRDVVRLFA